MSMKQWSLFTSTRGVYLLIIQIYVSVLKNGWVTLGPLSKTAWTVEPSWTAWTSEPHVPHEERSAGRTAPLTGRTILQPKAIRCSWYRVRALVRKCVRRSVCQRAVSARRALTGLSANHVRVKQYHVCPSANFCCVSAGKGSLPWSAFYNASRYIYFTPSQCPLAFKCFCFFSPESFPIMFLMVLCMAALIPISPLPLIIPVPWAFYFLPISKILWLSGVFFTPDYPIGFSLLPRIIPLSGPIPFIIVLHIFSHSANWLLHPVITAVLDLFPNVRFFLAQLLYHGSSHYPM